MKLVEQGQVPAASVGFFIALHQIIVVARRNLKLLLQLLDLAVSAAHKRRTVAFMLAYPLPPTATQAVLIAVILYLENAIKPPEAATTSGGVERVLQLKSKLAIIDHTLINQALDQ